MNIPRTVRFLLRLFLVPMLLALALLIAFGPPRPCTLRMAKAVEADMDNPSESTKRDLRTAEWEDYRDAWRFNWPWEVAWAGLFVAGLYGFRKLEYVPRQFI